jgi:hypothetical protein
MAGGSPRHNYLSAAAIAELRFATRGKGCHVLSPDQPVLILIAEQSRFLTVPTGLDEAPLSPQADRTDQAAPGCSRAFSGQQG